MVNSTPSPGPTEPTHINLDGIQTGGTLFALKSSTPTCRQGKIQHISHRSRLMNTTRRGSLYALASAAGALCVALALSAGPADVALNSPTDKKTPMAPQPPDGEKRVTVAEARERARLMHNIYAATLDVMHHHFFRRDRSVLPARAMEDVFAEMDRQSNIKAGWISVNTKAMSVHHEPKTEFEKQAAKAIAAGKTEFELVEKGYYHRAGAIPLGAGCVNCHTGFMTKTPQTQRFAGLVISVPINEK
jgi:hypothetical protein